MPEFDFSAEIALPAWDFWHVKNHPEFVDFQTRELGLKSVEELERWDDGDVTVYRMRTVPSVKLPRLVRSMLGSDEMSYEDVYEVRKSVPPYVSRFRTIPPVMPNRIKISGVITLEPRGDAACAQVLKGRADINVFGVGDLVGKTILENLRKSYVALPGLVQKFIAQRGGTTEGLVPPQVPDDDGAEAGKNEEGGSGEDSGPGDGAESDADALSTTTGSPFLTKGSSPGGGGGGEDSGGAGRNGGGSRSRRSSRSRRGHRRGQSSGSAHFDDTEGHSEYIDALSGDEEILAMLSDGDPEDMERLYPADELEISVQDGALVDDDDDYDNEDADHLGGEYGEGRGSRRSRRGNRRRRRILPKMPTFSLRGSKDRGDGDSHRGGAKPTTSTPPSSSSAPYRPLDDSASQSRAGPPSSPSAAAAGPRHRNYGTLPSSRGRVDGGSYTLFDEGPERKPSIFSRLLHCCIPPRKIKTVQHSDGFA